MSSSRINGLFQFIQTQLSIRTSILNFITILLLFIIIILPRILPFPPLFVTFDEIEIGGWSGQMAKALLSGDWQSTVNNAYPAVTLAWIDVIHIKVSQLLSNQSSIPLMFSDTNQEIFTTLPQRRLGLAVVNGIILIITFLLIRQLYNNFVAIVATILIALDPFVLTQARVFRTEGLVTGLMMLSALTILLYAKKRQGFWLIVSGVLGGWAVLTKFTSIYLLPFTGLTLLVWPLLKKSEYNIWQQLKLVIRDTLGWGLIMGLTVFVFWPVLWVAPLVAFNTVSKYLWDAMNGDLAWGGEVFFRGELIKGDPGILFYVWSLAYRTTPIVWLGLLIILISVIARFLLSLQKSKGSTPMNFLITFTHDMFPATLLISAYCTFYFVGMSLGSTKIDRFLQPIFPGLSILVGVGFLLLVEFLSGGGYTSRKGVQSFVLTGVLVSSLLLALPHHPYYYSYWNPLLGGAKTAVKEIPAGSLEGTDVLIERLNALPNVKEVNLVGAGEIIYFCSLIFSGNCLEESQFLASDYLLVELPILQRQIRLSNIQQFIPDVELVDKYTKDGVDYIWLYKMPEGLQPVDQWLHTHGKLSGYRLSANSIGAGDSLEVTIFWLNGENGWMLDDSEFFVRFRDEANRTWQTSAQLKNEFTPYLSRPNEFLVFTAPFNFPSDIALGVYTIEIGLRLKATGEETWVFSLPDSANTITVNRGALGVPTEALSIQHNLHQVVGETGLTLLGYEDMTDSESPGFAFYWQTQKLQSEEYILKLALLNSNSQAVISWSKLLAPEIHPITTWQPGEIAKLPLPLELAQPLPMDTYQPVLYIFPATGEQTNPLATINLWPIPKHFTLNQSHIPAKHRLDITFAEHLDLVGYDLRGQQSVNGGSLFVSLYWLNRQPLNKVETEVQVLNKNGKVIASQILPVPSPIGPSMWQCLSHYELPLKELPASLSIRTRPVGTEEWYPVESPNKSVTQQVTIEDILGKM